MSGAANDWPFLYQGLEKEFTDPGSLYYSGGGQFYNPQIMRSLSETSQTSSSGNNGGPSGSGGGGGGGGGGGSNPFLPAFNPIPTSGSQIAGDLQNEAEAAAAGAAAYGALYGVNAVLGALTAGELVIPGVGWLAAAATGLFELFEDLFGGGGSEPPTPRQLLHARHPLYPVILGVQDGLIPDEGSAATFLAKSDDAPESGVVLARYIAVPFSGLPEDVNQPPGNGFTERRGQNWYNPQTGQSLHPDPNHEMPKGPHYDLHSGLSEPKGKVSLRQFFDQFQYLGTGDRGVDLNRRSDSYWYRIMS